MKYFYVIRSRYLFTSIPLANDERMRYLKAMFLILKYNQRDMSNGLRFWYRVVVTCRQTCGEYHGRETRRS